MNEALQRELGNFLLEEGMKAPSFIDPIIDRVMIAVPLIAKEREYDYRDLLREQRIGVILDHKPNARFSALSPLRKVYLGIDGLERSWAYSYLFTGALVQFLSDGPHAISAPPADTLNERMRRSLEWAVENDFAHSGATYPTDLPKPQSEPYASSNFETLHFNSFVAAIAWITLHEIAHIVLNHSTSATNDLLKLQADELAADEWAAEWLLEKAPTNRDRIFRLNGISIGIALAAYLEMWTDAKEPSDHPIYPERLVAILDQFDSQCGEEKQRLGFWCMGAVLVFQRAVLAGKEKLFDEINPFSSPREFIQRARDAYPTLEIK